MNKKIFTTGEVLTINTNIREIEKNLGSHIPGGLIDPAELKDHILSPGEILTVCSNIRHIRGRRDRSYPIYPISSGGFGFFSILVGMVVLCLIIKLFELIFGVSIL